MSRAEYQAKVSWLSRAYKLDKSIRNLTEKITFLKATAQGTCVNINPEIVGGGFDGSKMETKVINYVDLEHKRDKLAKDLVTARKEISEAIQAVEDPALFAVLVSRYLDYKKWDDISEMLRVSYGGGYVFRLHRRAVNYVHLPQKVA